MMAAIFWVTHGIITAALAQVTLVSLQTWEHVRNVLRTRVAGTAPGRHAPALVVAPVKGDDPALESALEALFRLRYEHVLVRFVGESYDEPARRIVQQLKQRYPDRLVEWCTAGLAENCGQKVHNLLAALENPPPETEILAFVDADALIAPDWLELLVRRLNRCYMGGAATGYRDLVPMRPSFTNMAVYTLNSMTAGLLGPRSLHNCIWGGSWVIRRRTFDSLGIADAWRRQLDDDYVATTVLRNAGLRVAYEPRVTAGSSIDMRFAQAGEFAVRQMFLTRVYAPGLWKLVFCGWTVSLLGLLGLPVLGGWAWSQGAAWAPLTLWSWLTIYLSASARAVARQWAARTARPQLDLDWSTRCFEIVLHPLASILGYVALVRSAFGRTIAWRNIAYRLDRSGKVLEIRRESSTPGDPGQSPGTTERHRAA